MQRKPVEIVSTVQKNKPGEEVAYRAEEPGEQVPEVAPSIESRIDSLRGGGAPLSGAQRDFFQPRFGTDFSGVRVHSDAGAAELARSVNAQAFTVGRDIVFGAGRYAPETEPGKLLLAHELTHVVQQQGGAVQRAMVLQRAPECSIGHIDAECTGATARCQAIQESYCKQKYPTPQDIETLHQKAIKGANDQKKKYPYAGENLLHFLGGSGAEKIMTADVFKNHSETQDKLAGEHRQKFMSGAEKRLKSGALKPGTPADMTWTGTANAFSFVSRDDLGLAVGGYTLCSKANVSVSDKGSGKYELTFGAWTVQAFDCYNWDPGKGIGLPGADDNDLCCLENAGKGKHFKIRTDVWNNAHAPSMEKAVISG